MPASPPLQDPYTYSNSFLFPFPPYQWRELPQFFFFFFFCRDKHVFVATKHDFFRDKSMLAATKVLSRQNYDCIIFVATNTCLSRQTRVCRDKRMLAATKLLSRQVYFCRDKTRLLSRQTRVCRDKHNFVATKLLSRQAYVSRDKHVFVATKMILVAVPANDTSPFLLW